MKLIDILVRDLKNNGGWPHGAEGVMQDDNGRLWFSRGGIPGFFPNGINVVNCALLFEKSSDFSTSIITKSQYESALLESIKSVKQEEPTAEQESISTQIIHVLNQAAGENISLSDALEIVEELVDNFNITKKA